MAEYVAFNRIKPFVMSHTVRLPGFFLIDVYSKKAGKVGPVITPLLIQSSPILEKMGGLYMEEGGGRRRGGGDGKKKTGEQETPN